MFGLHGRTELFRCNSVDTLLDNRAEGDRASSGSAVEMLVAIPGIDVNHANTSFGKTALIYASANGHTDIVEMLLAAPEIDVNRADTGKGDYTPLIYASINRHTDIVEMLRSAGAV